MKAGMSGKKRLALTVRISREKLQPWHRMIIHGQRQSMVHPANPQEAHREHYPQIGERERAAILPAAALSKPSRAASEWICCIPSVCLNGHAIPPRLLAAFNGCRWKSEPQILAGMMLPAARKRSTYYNFSLSGSRRVQPLSSSSSSSPDTNCTQLIAVTNLLILPKSAAPSKAGPRQALWAVIQLQHGQQPQTRGRVWAC